MAASGPGLAEYMEAVARKHKGEVPEGYGYSADIELGVGFFKDERTGCSVLEKPFVIPSGDSSLQGYVMLFAYSCKEGVESLLSGQVPPMLPATRKEPKHFASLEAIADNFGAKEPAKKTENSKFCVPLRVPAAIVSQADTPGRDLWLVRFDQDRITPFLVAAKEGDAEKVSRFISEANVPGSTMDEHGVTALMMAAMTGNADTCKVLLDNGANVNAVEPTSSRTAAMFAAQGGKTEVLSGLLTAKADLAMIDSEGQTALMWAAVAGQAGAAALLAANSSKEAKNMQGMTAAQIAEKMGHVETARAIA